MGDYTTPSVGRPLRRAVDLGRRAALGTLAAGAAGFALFGPRGARAERGRLVLDYWEKWTGHEAGAMEEIIADFNASQDRIYVRYLVTAGIAQKAAIAIAGGRPPDLIGLWYFSLPQFAESEAVLPLDALAEGAGVREELAAPAFRPVVRYRGRRWGVVSTAGTLALYYNRRVFRERLGTDEPPRTMEELQEINRRLTVRDASGRLRAVGFMHTEPGWWMWPWGAWWGGTFYDEARDRSRVLSAENLAAFEWMRRTSAELGVEAAEAFRKSLGNYGQPENGFLDGRVAMVLQGPWMANMIRRFRPDLDYGVAPMPTIAALRDDAAPVGLVDTDVLVIPRGARHPEASMEFIAFTQRRENAERLATAHGKVSPLAEVSEAFLAGHPNRGLDVHTALARSPRAFRFPATRVWPQFMNEFALTANAIWSHQVGVEAGLRRAHARFEQLLEEADAQRVRRGRASLRASAGAEAEGRGDGARR